MREGKGVGECVCMCECAFVCVHTMNVLTLLSNFWQICMKTKHIAVCYFSKYSYSHAKFSFSLALSVH